MHTHKSYRRKYRKIMVKFQKEFDASNGLFRDQERLYDISQRIAEQNDQLIALLLELNSQPQIPARLRYDLQDAATTKKPEKHENEDAATDALRVTRYRIQRGELRQPAYEDLEHDLLETVEFAPKQFYADLLKGAPLERQDEQSLEASGPLLGGFLSGKQEDAYLQALDDFLDRKSNHPRTHVVGNPGARNMERTAERDREAQLRNPVSVYNWLRKNQPQVFLQDQENEKTKISASNRKSKREPNSKTVKNEPDLYDDDGIAVEDKSGAAAAKGKRKRDEDGGYRPKGGHARPSKRRKGDESRKSKGASVDISA